MFVDHLVGGLHTRFKASRKGSHGDVLNKERALSTLHVAGVWQERVKGTQAPHPAVFSLTLG